MQKFSNFKNFFLQELPWYIFGPVIALVFTASFLLLVLNLSSDLHISKIYSSVQEVKLDLKPRLLDGVLVELNQARNRPIAVVIENHLQSRPAVGIDRASILYETIVEGEITRFLAIFDPSQDVKKIGPVRSLRPFFTTLAEEYDAVLFHAGGSPAALEEIKYSAVWNINEISADGVYFWRDIKRYAPHNLYTSTALAIKAMEKHELASTTDFISWEYGAEIQGTATGQIIEIPFSRNTNYQVSYHYSSSTNDYTRYQGDQAYLTEEDAKLTAKNLIIQHVNYRVLDSYGRLAIFLDSSGPAEIYRDGIKINGSWEKVNGRTFYYDENEDPIKFNPGKIYIALVFF